MNKLLKLFVLLVCVFFVRSAVAMPLESDQRIEIGTDSYSIHQGKDLESAKCYVLKPEGFSKLKDFLLSHKGITRLDLSVYTQEGRLPEDFFEGLERLRYLVINCFKLSSVPASIGCLINLQKLYLNNNELRSLPPEIGQLKELEVLHVGTNQLGSLPKSIGNLGKLQSLYLAFNNLTYLPRSIVRLTSLKWLPLDGNKIDYIPKELLDREMRGELGIDRL